jgi:MFS family permease
MSKLESPPRQRIDLPRERLVPLIVACGLFMENLDSTVLATALPAIAKSLDVNPLRLNLAITAYLFSLAVFIPVSGWVADKFGARDVFRVAIGVFVAGSVLCGFSSSMVALVVARVIQGVGGAMMVPVGRLVVLRLVPQAGLVRAMTYLSVPALIGPVIGPPLGGLITTYGSWRWIFWINVPIGVLGIYLVTRFVPDAREHDVPPIDIRDSCSPRSASSAWSSDSRPLAGGWYQPAPSAPSWLSAWVAVCCTHATPGASAIPFWTCHCSTCPPSARPSREARSSGSASVRCPFCCRCSCRSHSA